MNHRAPASTRGPDLGADMKTTTTRAGRLLATASLIATAVLVAACDLVVGPPVHDVGYEHNVGPATEPRTGGPHRSPSPGHATGAGATGDTSRGTAGRRTARSTPHG